MKTLKERLLEKVQISPDRCWEWGASTNRGYGQIGVGGRPLLAHRVSWAVHFGPIPDNVWVLHKCDNRRCINPDHLFLGTVLDNVRDMDNKGRGNRAKIALFGSSNGQSKLTEKDVINIREERGLSQRKIGVKYGVSRELIGQILRGQIRKG